MKILLVRHAPAENALAWAAADRPDSERPLTADGKRRMVRIAAALARLEPDVGRILSSSYRRAVETAQILAGALPGETRLEVAPELAPGEDPWPLMTREVRSSHEAILALVGHEPDLSQLAGLLLLGTPRSVLELKKGGAVLLEVGNRLEPGQARLLWSIPPGVLRRTGA